MLYNKYIWIVKLQYALCTWRRYYYMDIDMKYERGQQNTGNWD
jgi:hypothetical protein